MIQEQHVIVMEKDSAVAEVLDKMEELLEKILDSSTPSSHSVTN